MSKKICILAFSCLLSTNAFTAQRCVGELSGQLEEIQKKVVDQFPDCKKPDDTNFSNICSLVDSSDMRIHDKIKTMACVKSNDEKKIREAKVQNLFAVYKEDFGCDSSGFTIEFGNILKYSVHKNFSIFVDSVVNQYNLDINFKDPSDGKTLLDFVKDEIERYGRNNDHINRVNELKNLYKHLKDDLKAKHSNEI